MRLEEDVLQDGWCKGTLQRDEALAFQDLPVDLLAATLVPFGQLVREVAGIFLATAGVGDDVKGFRAKASNDRVIDDATGAWVEERGKRRVVSF